MTNAWAAGSTVVVVPVEGAWRRPAGPADAFQEGYWSLRGLTKRQVGRSSVGTERERWPSRRFEDTGVAKALEVHATSFATQIPPDLHARLLTEQRLDVRAVERRCFQTPGDRSATPETVEFLVIHGTLNEEALSEPEVFARGLRRPAAGNALTKLLAWAGFDAVLMNAGRVARYRGPGDLEWGTFYPEPFILTHLVPHAAPASPPSAMPGPYADAATYWAWQMAGGAPAATASWLPPLTEPRHSAAARIMVGNTVAQATQHGLALIGTTPLLDGGTADCEHQAITRFMHTWGADLALLAWRQRRAIEMLGASAAKLSWDLDSNDEAAHAGSTRQMLTLSERLQHLNAYVWFTTIPYRDQDTALLSILQSAMSSPSSLEALHAQLDRALTTLSLVAQQDQQIHDARQRELERHQARREGQVNLAIALIAIPSLVLTSTQLARQPGYDTLGAALAICVGVLALVLLGYRIWSRRTS